MTKKGKINFKEKLEDFFYSDSISATATKFLLAGLALGGFIFGGAVIPGMLKAIDSFKDNGGNNYNKRELKKYSEKQIKTAFYNLKRRKMVKIIKIENGKVKIKLTNKGRKRLKEFVLDSLTIKKPKKWDGLWRIVIFDIPVKHNTAREALRGKIKELGFKQLQESVWFFPYECEDEILFVAKMFGADRYIEIITANQLLHEKELKKVFKL